jgi:hypothetical protein
VSKLTRNCPECDKGLEYKSVSARNLQFISWDENRDKWFRRALEV